MREAPKEGDTYFRSGDDHLWVVVSDPGKDPFEVVAVNVTTFDPALAEDGRRDHDDSCLLEPGDHPFIQHRSCVYYGGANNASAELFTLGVRTEVIQPQPPVSPEVLARIRQGARKTRHLKRGPRDILRKQGLI